MKLHCPECGAHIDVLEHLKAQEERELFDLYAEFGNHARLMREYLDLFRSPGGSLTVRRHHRALKELVEVYRQERFEFTRRYHPIRKSDFLDAVRQVCDRGLKHLQNHNYLKKVLLPLSGKQAARQEIAAEADKRVTPRSGETQPDRLDAMKHLEQIKARINAAPDPMKQRNRP